jgi:membrane-associated phospholipid phosphatase
VAGYFETHVRHSGLWFWLDRALQPLTAVILLAQLFLLACGIWRASGRQLRPWTGTLLLCSLAAMWALAAEVVFKTIFGRSSPDPAYVQYHVYEFQLLHGGPHRWSFPSGTAIISAAIVAVLWPLIGRWRRLGALVVFALSVAVVVTNYHWLSDVIAGVFLGVSIGWFTVRLLYPMRFNADK